MSYTSKNLKQLSEDIQKKKSGIYIAYNKDMFDAITYLAKEKGITPEELGVIAFNKGILQLLEEVTN
jgi:hypothetical protein